MTSEEPNPHFHSMDFPANLEIFKLFGAEWKKDDKHRVYINDLAERYGLKLSFYKTGNISSATLNGEKISNSRGQQIRSDFGVSKLYWDANKQTFEGVRMDPQTFETLCKSVIETYKKFEAFEKQS